jgi:hypothetical protein
MPLINSTDIVTLRKYVRMSHTATAVKSMPDLDAAERKFLIPILTEEVFDELQEHVTNNTLPDEWKKLLNFCRAAVAPLAVWLDLPFIQSDLSDGGLKSDDNAAHQWEYREIEKALVNKGMAALEDLIEHLLKHGDDYSWVNEKTKESFFRTGTDMSPRYVWLSQPNLTFQQLIPLMREVEDHFIKPVIGLEFFEELRDKEEPNKEEEVAIELIKKAIAQYTVVRAVERMPVKITPFGLMATLQNNTEASNVEKPADKGQLDTFRASAQREADSYFLQLTTFLNTNASTTIFLTYYSGVYYKAPVTEEPVDPYSELTGVFPM